jgi:hypothetical protein
MLIPFAKELNAAAPKSVLLNSVAVLISFAKRLIATHSEEVWGMKV